MTELHYLSAIELAAKVRRREVGCLELLELHLKRLERINPKINAVIWSDLAGARARAKAADAALTKGELWGPLHGLPMTIKESFNLTGSPTTWGDPAYKNNIAKDNAVATQRLLDAGAIIYGKTNVPIALADWQSFNAIYGTTNNPWDVTKTPGGSSGGSAAALATGMAALELGSDIGASIRNPAHYCGVLGHKPTHNIVPTRGQSLTNTVSIPDISVAGPMARTAEDLALALSLLAGSDEIEAAGLKLDLPAPRATKIKDLRIAVMTGDPTVSAVDDEYQGKLRALGEALAKLGAKVSFTAKPAFNTREASKLYIKLLRSFTMARAAPDYLKMLEERAKTLKADDDSFQAWVLRSFNISYREWLAANEERQKLRWHWHDFFKEWDVLLCPTAAGPAFPHDQKGDRLDRYIEVNGKLDHTCHQLFWAGYSGMVFLPSTTCPIERHSNGLPLSVQIIGPHLGDRTTIELARLIGREFGGFQPPPDYV